MLTKKILKDFWKPISISLMFIWMITPAFSQAQNLALNRNYILSTNPNYPYSAPPSDKSSLTDGVYTKEKSFWNQRTTVGWQSKEVTVTIDLGKIVPIGEVDIHTFRSIKSDIYFPQNLFVFVSNDAQKYKYIGDAADILDNQPGILQFKTFNLSNINEFARYITIVIIPEGSFIFCDEIQVLKSSGKNIEKVQSLVKDSLNQFIDSLRIPQFSKRSLAKINDQLFTSGNTNSKEVSDIDTKLKLITTDSQLPEIKKTLGKIHAVALKNRFGVPFILEKYNPWDTISEFHDPQQNDGILNYEFILSIDGVEYGSFVLTNSSAKVKQFSFDISKVQSKYNIELFQVDFVPISYFDLIPDALVKVVDSTSIQPGISKMFIFKLTGMQVGSANSSISISSFETNRKINLTAKVVLLSGLNIYPNANVWAYFNNPMIKNFKNEIAKDLVSHHINTLVIPPNVLPNIKTQESDAFIKYLASYQNLKNILLFMDYSSSDRRNGYKNGQFLSPEWQKYFISWYSNLKQQILEKGDTGLQVYLYPYDEIKSANISDFKKLIAWAKNAIPDVKFYATLGSEAAVDSILPLIDIAQINIFYPKINQLPSHHAEVWIYGGATPSRTLSPYRFYRLMSWNAFVQGYSGIGFWNYADERNGGRLNLISGSTFNPSGSYSVIYNNPDGTIISSRRWEAFRLGIEDYPILQAYSKKFGIRNARAMASKVTNNPNNLNLADSVRTKMILSLSGK